MAGPLTHLDESGRPRMVDVGGKEITARTARAEGSVRFSKAAYNAFRNAPNPKGDPLRFAELAGVMGAKRTADLIPLCHPVPLSRVTVEAEYDNAAQSVRISAEVAARAPTGVEMEALTAVSVACLTLYDMAKAIDKGIVIGPVALLEKTGGKSGDFKRVSDNAERG